MSVKFDASKSNNPFSFGSGDGGASAMQKRAMESAGVFSALTAATHTSGLQAYSPDRKGPAGLNNIG